MKRIFTLAAAATMVLAASANTRVLYSQTFETVISAEEAGWTSPSNAAALTINSDDFGSYLTIDHKATNANGRTYDLFWGSDLYTGSEGSYIEDGVYTLKFDLNTREAPVSQYNTSISVLTNLRCPDNQPYINRWSDQTVDPNSDPEEPTYLQNQGYLFDLSQLTPETPAADQYEFMVNGDVNDVVIMRSDWYTVTLVVNVNDRTVDYLVETLSGEVITEGTRNIPETDVDGSDISMYAEGLHIMGARYTTVLDFDNIMLSCESQYDVANTPSAALTRVGKDGDGNLDLRHRAYTISWMPGELLKIIGTDGAEMEVEYDETENGSYEYATSTSGTLTIWTEYGSAKCDEIVINVNCDPIALPEAQVAITSVSNGYGKSYKFTVDNKVVPLSPTIFIQYSFQGENGETIPVTEAGSGVVIDVKNKGTLTLTTAAFGYQSTTITVENNKEYGEKFVVDFARMTADEIKAKGFAQIDDLNSGTTSGEPNWTARKRLFYYDAATKSYDDEGNEVYTAVYPFGYIADDDAEHVIHRYLIDADAMTEEVATGMFENVTLWNGLAAQILEHIGLTQNATSRNYNIVKVNCGANDVVVCNTTNSYGADSCHPIVNTVDEYYAVFGGTDYAFAMATTPHSGDDGQKDGTTWAEPLEDGTYSLHFKLYRIDTALTKVTCFTQVGGPVEDGINDIIAAPVVTDNAYYTIDGLKLNAPVKSGVYVHNGKKVYIVK